MPKPNQHVINNNLPSQLTGIV